MRRELDNTYKLMIEGVLGNKLNTSNILATQYPLPEFMQPLSTIEDKVLFVQAFVRRSQESLESLKHEFDRDYKNKAVLPVKRDRCTNRVYEAKWLLLWLVFLGSVGASFYAIAQAPKRFGSDKCIGVDPKPAFNDSSGYHPAILTEKCHTLGFLALIIPVVIILLVALSCATYHYFKLPRKGLLTTPKKEAHTMTGSELVEKLNTVADTNFDTATISFSQLQEIEKALKILSKTGDDYFSAVDVSTTLNDHLNISMPPQYSKQPEYNESTGLLAAAPAWNKRLQKCESLRQRIAQCETVKQTSLEQLERTYDSIIENFFPHIGAQVVIQVSTNAKATYN